ncbi:MAG TPA: hypothetical protein VG675_02480 [Bryobacteraceae bacterium]|nr:hypothetical protein [Bryobacteraceae bacterium]
MRYRLLAALFAGCLAATAQTLSVNQLISFIKSSIELKQSDKEVAGFLSKVKLSDRLDDRTIEELQGLGIGPRTLHALDDLRDESKALSAARITPEKKVVPIPPPSSEEQAAIIDEVREYALNYSRNLPDFICTQVTRRYAAAEPGTKYGGSAGSDPYWQLQDTLTIRLSYFQQKEDYKLVLVNNRVTNQEYQALGGAVSSGEFGSMLRDIFERKTQAHFEWDHWGTLRGRRVLAFAYRVAKQNSDWRIDYEHRLDLVPGYSGLVEVDKETHKVMRVTLKADDIPAAFPIREAETVLDYDFQEISGNKFLLPLKAETRMKADGVLTRNDEEFRLYRKFSTESQIQFDNTPPPLPDSQTKEQPAQPQPSQPQPPQPQK